MKLLIYIHLKMDFSKRELGARVAERKSWIQATIRSRKIFIIWTPIPSYE